MSRPSLLSTLKDYSEPVVNQNKELYIEFYVVNPYTGKKQRKRIRLNHLKGTAKQRLREANEYRRNLSDKLKNGWNPFVAESEPRPFSRLSGVVRDYMADKRSLRPDTLRTYRSALHIFKTFTDKHLGEDCYITLVDKRVAREFLRIKYDRDQISNRTYNNYLRTLYTFFAWAEDHDYCRLNPFKGIALKKNALKHRIYFTREQWHKLSAYIDKVNEPFTWMCRFSYYTITRRKEITFLKVKDIDLERNLVYIDGKFSKNGKSEYVSLSDIMVNHFYSIGLDTLPGHYYVFSEDFLPGHRKLKPKKISDLWGKYRAEVEMSDRLQFMSLRDTYIRNGLREGVPIDEMMKQARHHSLEITKTYLVHDVVEAVPSIIAAQEF